MNQKELTGPVHGLGGLTARLVRARLGQREGESLLYLAGILAYTVTISIALMIAGGTWMFYNRANHPRGLMGEVVAIDPSFKSVLFFYFGLAIFACALIVPSIISLAAKSAVLGAKGRENRLASLRLLGLSSGEVTRMALLECFVQSIIGAAAGIAIYLLSLQLWTKLNVQATQIEAKEMLLPWWLLLSVLGFLMLIALASSWWGMQQVRISPLGVAKKSNKPALKVWRVAAFFALIAGALIANQVFVRSAETTTFIILGSIVLAVVYGFNLLGPYLLQILARLISKLRWPALMVAARRIIADPKATWRRVFGMGLLAFIAGYVSNMPVSFNSDQHLEQTIKSFVELSRWDINKGVMITLVISFVLNSVSMLVNQASDVIERAEQSRALAKIGAPKSFELRVIWLETLGPLALAVLMGGLLGTMFSMPMVNMYNNVTGEMPETSYLQMSMLMAAGLLVSALAILACHPLYRRVLAQQRRTND